MWGGRCGEWRRRSRHGIAEAQERGGKGRKLHCRFKMKHHAASTFIRGALTLSARDFDESGGYPSHRSCCAATHATELGLNKSKTRAASQSGIRSVSEPEWALLRYCSTERGETGVSSVIQAAEAAERSAQCTAIAMRDRLVSHAGDAGRPSMRKDAPHQSCRRRPCPPKSWKGWAWVSGGGPNHRSGSLGWPSAHTH